MSNYRAPGCVPGGDLQTIVGAISYWPRLEYTRCRWSLEHPRDFIDVDWAGDDGERPLLVLFHGLEGHSDAPYARKLGAYAVEQGWRFAVPHFRGCSGEPNLQLRSYHAGASDEIGLMLERFVRDHGSPVFAAGVSLGANALLRWLGEQGANAARLVHRAAAISAPLNLHVTGAALERGLRILYAKFFLGTTLRRRALAKLDRFPGAYDRRCVRAAGTLRQFDDAVTAPVHGFVDVNDYWTQSSSERFLEGIGVPTLLLNARNDPFLPDHVLRGVETLRDRDRLPPEVTLDFQDEGGHAAFPSREGWLPRHVFEFLAET